MVETQTGAPIDEEAWLLTTPLRLAPGVELLTGANDELLLFRADTGRYVRVSPSAAKLLDRLDGATTIELVTTLSREYSVPETSLLPNITRFVTELRNAEVLDIDAAPRDRRDKVVDTVRRLPLLRLRLVKRFTLLDLVARLVRPLGRFGVVVASALALAGLVAGFLALTHVGVPERPTALAGLVLLAVMLTQIALHEVGHAVACSLSGVPAREAGVGLLFYFLPIAYVDRTDSYRVKSKWARTGIAMAGPMVDGLSIGVLAIVAISSSGPVQGVAVITMSLLIFMFFFNLNPLLPTDGHQALEAMAGELNFRARAMGYALAKLLRKPIPHFYDLVSARRRGVYLAYGVGSIAYVMFLMIMMFGSVLMVMVNR
jgi:putative peptide zinc metalloprotease protein